MKLVGALRGSVGIEVAFAFAFGLTSLLYSDICISDSTVAPHEPRFGHVYDGLEHFWDGYVSDYMQSTGASGFTVSIVQGGATIFAKGYGFIDADERLPIDANSSLFRVGSISKLFTYTAIMQLYEQGKIDLDADVNQYMQGFALSGAFSSPITVRHLLTHTSGLEDSLLGGLFDRSIEEARPIKESLQLYRPKRITPPGEVAAYSNFGVTVLGYVVESVAKEPYHKYVEDNILEPLQMRHSTFREPPLNYIDGDQVKAYSNFKGQLLSEDFIFLSSWAPAGSLSSTSADIANFMIAHLQKGRFLGRRILDYDTAATMHETAFTLNSALPGMTLGFIEFQHNGYRALSHRGATINFYSYLFLIPELQLGVFYSTASAGSARINDPFIAFMDNFHPPTRNVRPDFIASNDLSTYIGKYRDFRMNFSKIEKLFEINYVTTFSATEDGLLLMHRNGRFTKLRPIGDALFQAVKGQQRLFFTRDSSNTYDIVQVASMPHNYLYRISWWSQPNTLYSVLLFTALLCITSVVHLYRLRSTPISMQSIDATSSRLIYFLSLFTIAAIVFAILSVINADNIDLIIDYIPLHLKLTSHLALGVAATALILIYVSVRAWIHYEFTLYFRIHCSLLAMAAVLLAWNAHYWNLI
jgi:CubicO group peptidase (beta-lactamase class C family)